MPLSKELAIQFKYENEILELIENQMRSDENSLTQSDVQGRVSAIVMSLLSEKWVCPRYHITDEDGTWVKVSELDKVINLK